MLAVLNTSWPPIENGVLSASWMRNAIALACCSSLSRGSRIANSSPPSRARVVGPQTRLEPPRHGNEQFVAHEVAQAVVHHLEPIEVEVEHANRCSIRRRLNLIKRQRRIHGLDAALAGDGQRLGRVVFRRAATSAGPLDGIRDGTTEGRVHECRIVWRPRIGDSGSCQTRRVIESNLPIMPMSVRRECPACIRSIGLARKAAVVHGKPGVTVTLVCEACGHEWDVQHDSPPLRPTIEPPDNLGS